MHLLSLSFYDDPLVSFIHNYACVSGGCLRCAGASIGRLVAALMASLRCERGVSALMFYLRIPDMCSSCGTYPSVKHPQRHLTPSQLANRAIYKGATCKMQIRPRICAKHSYALSISILLDIRLNLFRFRTWPPATPTRKYSHFLISSIRFAVPRARSSFNASRWSLELARTVGFKFFAQINIRRMALGINSLSRYFVISFLQPKQLHLIRKEINSGCIINIPGAFAAIGMHVLHSYPNTELC